MPKTVKDFVEQASKARALSSANYEGHYDADTDKIHITISNVSESFVPSKSSDNDVIHCDIPLLTRLKAMVNVVLVK